MKSTAHKWNEETGQIEAKPAKKSQAGLTARKARLVVIEDDQGMQALLADVLRSMGYLVTTFSDATGAVKLLAAGGEIDAVICDLNMPKLNGLDFLDVLARMRCPVPVILITAFGTDRTAEAARSKGAYAYLSKPFQLSEMSETVRRAIADRR